MRKTVGEVAKALGIPADTIRFYVKEGLIKPEQNEKNGYWEYTSNETFKIADIMFYRSMGLTLDDIKVIMSGIPLEQIGDVIGNRLAAITEALYNETRSMSLLSSWLEKYRAGMALIGKYIIGEMPSEYRRIGNYGEGQHLASYIETCFDLDKEDWRDVSLSFFCDTTKSELKLEHYFSIKAERKIKAKNIQYLGVEEKHPCCLITQVPYDDDPMVMIRPMQEYAAANNIALTGVFYGRETTDYFVDGRHTSLYRLYGPISGK